MSDRQARARIEARLARGGMAQIARKAKLTREATYKMLSRPGNPELRSLTSVLEAAGLRIAFIDPKATEDCLIELAELPEGHA